MLEHMQDQIDRQGSGIEELQKEMQDRETARPPDELSNENVVAAAARALRFSTR